jgi:hypothetical protein
MTKPEPTNDPLQSDPHQQPDNVHRAHAAGTGREDEAASGDPQPRVPRGDKGDPTHDTWQQIDESKVQTVKEEMPAPEKVEK